MLNCARITSRSLPALYTAQPRNLSMKVHAGAKELIEENVQKNKVMLFTKSHCPYSIKAKTVVGSILPQDKFTVMEIDLRPDCAEIQDAMVGITGGRSVPRVFIDGKFIGGGDDTVRLGESGELKALFQKAGVL